MENEFDFSVPRHVAIIMDGNGRWAEKRGLPRVKGHYAGAENVERLLDFIRKYGVEYVTLYAFSTENWKRSKEEVDALWELMAKFLADKCGKMIKNNVRLLATGRIDALPEKTLKELRKVTEKTSQNYKYTLILAVNYGGRAEIVDAAKKIAAGVREGKISPDDVTEKLFSENLYLPDIPDPDLMIRTSGEMRISNFLLWELSYAEFAVTDTLWPDFDEEEFVKILKDFSKRDRRFGGRK